jgi:hypothetical protein
MKFELLNFGYCIVIKSYVALFVLSVFYHITLTCNTCTTFAKNKIKFFELTLSGYTYCKAQCQGRTPMVNLDEGIGERIAEQNSKHQL